MYNFDYAKPGSLAEAVEALKADEAQALGGGQTLIPTLKQRLASPSVLVDLSGSQVPWVCHLHTAFQISSMEQRHKVFQIRRIFWRCSLVPP